MFKTGWRSIFDGKVPLIAMTGLPNTVFGATDFHLMRPAWLLLIPLALWIYWRLRQRTTPSDWPAFISPHLMPFLVSDPNDSQRAKKNWLPNLWLITSLLLLLALSGPAWQRLPQPVTEKLNAMVIVLDLSLSMTATDITPSRIARARFKVQDLLNQRKEGLTGLVVYAGDAHTVVPLTEDTSTISALLPSLTPWLMPIKGSRPDLAITEAVAVLDGGTRGVNQQRGHIVLISDALDPTEIDEVKSQLNGTQHRVSILAIGTPGGAPITLPNGQHLKDNQGNLVLPKLDLPAMESFGAGIDAPIITLTNNDADIKALLRRTPSAQLAQNDQGAKNQQISDDQALMNTTLDVWQDEAFWLVWLLLPLGALFFRRGYLLSFLLLCATLSMTLPTTTYALDWSELWKTSDQQGQAAFEDGDYQKASETFEDPDWQRAAAYRAGDYAQAASKSLATDSPQDHHNRGNALALKGDLAGAIKAYDAALAADPKLEDAEYNREIVKALLAQQSQDESENQSEQSQSEDQDKQDQDKQDQQQQQGQNQEEKSDQQGQDQQNGDSQNAKSDSDSDSGSDSEQNNTDQSDTDQSTANQQQQAQENTEDTPPEERPAAQQPTEQDIDEMAEQRKATAQAREQSQPNEEPAENEGQVIEDTLRTEAEARAAEEQQQALERVIDDPGGLLRRKFILESRRRKSQPQQNEPLW